MPSPVLNQDKIETETGLMPSDVGAIKVQQGNLSKDQLEKLEKLLRRPLTEGFLKRLVKFGCRARGYSAWLADEINQAIEELGDEVDLATKLLLVRVVLSLKDVWALDGYVAALGGVEYQSLRLPFSLLRDPEAFYEGLDRDEKGYTLWPPEKKWKVRLGRCAGDRGGPLVDPTGALFSLRGGDHAGPFDDLTPLLNLVRVHREMGAELPAWDSEGKGVMAWHWSIHLSDPMLDNCVEQVRSNIGRHHIPYVCSVYEFYECKREGWWSAAEAATGLTKITELREVLESDYPPDQLLTVYMLCRAWEGDHDAAYLLALAYDDVIAALTRDFHERHRPPHTWEDWLQWARDIAVATIMGNTEAVVEAVAQKPAAELDIHARARALRPSKIRNVFAWYERTPFKTWLKYVARTLQRYVNKGRIDVSCPAGTPEKKRDPVDSVRKHFTDMLCMQLSSDLDLWLRSARATSRDGRVVLGARYDPRRSSIPSWLSERLPDALKDLWRRKEFSVAREKGEVAESDIAQKRGGAVQRGDLEGGEFEIVDGGPSSFSGVDQRLLVEQLIQEANLSTLELQVIWRHRKVMGDETAKEIAEDLGISESSISRAKKSAVHKLRSITRGIGDM